MNQIKNLCERMAGADLPSDITKCAMMQIGMLADEIRELRQAIEQAEKVEPVAWKYDFNGDWWLTDDKTKADQIAKQGRVVNPLYARPPPAQNLNTDGIVGWRWIATCGSGAYQLRNDEPMRGYSYKAPVYEVLPTAPAQPLSVMTQAQTDTMWKACPHFGPSPARRAWIAAYEDSNGFARSKPL